MTSRLMTVVLLVIALAVWPWLQNKLLHDKISEMGKTMVELSETLQRHIKQEAKEKRSLQNKISEMEKNLLELPEETR